MGKKLIHIKNFPLVTNYAMVKPISIIREDSMIGTLAGFILAAYLLFFKTTSVNIAAATPWLEAMTLALGVTLALLQGYAWYVLQQAELKATPRILELYWQRGRWLFAAIYIPVAAVMAAFFLDSMWSIALWLVALGITVDSIYHTVSRIFTHLTPPTILPLYHAAARNAVRENNPKALCQWIDASVEAALQSIEGRRPTFCLQIFDELQGMMKFFLENSKSIAHNTLTLSEDGRGHGDTVVYVMLFLLQRLELLGQRSIEQRLEPVTTSLITTLGRMTVDGARYDISVAQYPLHYLGRMTHLAMSHGMIEIVAKSNYTLQEIARQTANLTDLAYVKIVDFFTLIINQLEGNTAALFKHDKGIHLKVLQQPFLDLQHLFQQEPLSKHRDATDVLQVINSALGQFQALEEVMMGMPMPQAEANAEASVSKATMANVDDEGLSAKIVQDLEERLGQQRRSSGDKEESSMQQPETPPPPVPEQDKTS
jgi:hypothetical protein